MTDATAPAAYTPLQKGLHWAVVVLLIFQYLVFDGMGKPFHEGLKSGTMPYTTTSIAHIAIGLSVLAIAGWRLWLRSRHGAPAAPEGEPEMFRTLSKLGHWALYLMLFAMPIGGLIAWFGQVPFVADAHAVGSNVLLAIAGLHVAAVATHQFWWRTGLLGRMT